MTEPRLQLAVLGEGDAFAAYLEEAAVRHGLELRRARDPEPIRASRTALVILLCAGREEEALGLLAGAQRVGIDDAVVVGARADHWLAVELMRHGADGYYALPGDADRLEEEIATRAARYADRDSPLAAAYREAYDFARILGEDRSLRAALQRAAQVIPSGRATVLITGETGTGKELVAQAIHYNGPRGSEPFVTVNCSAIPATLLESELFGHEKGAFTDARVAKPGLFEVADGGSLFLDEISSLPLEPQAKLLRVLESGEVRRVGGVRAKLVDVRIIAAANVDLHEMVGRRDFREDLFYRLAVIPIHLPPLRDREGDVPILARHFLARFAEEYGVEPPPLSGAALRALQRHPWPGNVRELRNAMERAILLSASKPIRPDHLGLLPAQAAPAGESRSSSGSLPFPATLDEIEAAATVAMLRKCGGNKSEAARRLGITRSRLYRILRRREL